jgi:hypothetical protein
MNHELNFKNMTAEITGNEPLGPFVQISEKDSDGLHVLIEMDEARALRDWLNRTLPGAHGSSCPTCGGNGTEAKPYQLACAAAHPGPFRDERGFYEKHYLPEARS